MREGGLEPPHLSAYAPQAHVSTNSTIRASGLITERLEQNLWITSNPWCAALRFFKLLKPVRLAVDRLYSMKNILLFSVACLFVTPVVFAQTDTSDALAQAQAVLKDRVARDELFKKDPKARQADDFASTAVGGDAGAKDELYGISADIMAQLVKDGNQDPAKMQEIMKKALENPESFKKSLSPDIQARIDGVVKKTEAHRAVNGSKDKSLKSP